VGFSAQGLEFPSHHATIPATAPADLIEDAQRHAQAVEAAGREVGPEGLLPAQASHLQWFSLPPTG
ncbi:MAG: hypothetical protein QF593_13355, partial [Nitrospinota bacterium]|nr:hypothetical protein [Nitrospinota bacterium]